MEQTKKRSAISLVIEFAGQKKPNYIFSVLLAMCKVVFGLMPYLYMADIVGKLLEMHAGTLEKDMSLLSASIIKMAIFWLLCRICHAISTTLSHAATFEVLANIRRQLTEKLSKLPLGSILSQSNAIYRVQMPDITPHISNQAKAGMNPKTLQYLIICVVIRVSFFLSLLFLIILYLLFI